MRPLVSFVIPVRNDALRLRRCLASIVSNSYPRELIEIIVVDNESTDGSAKAASEYGAIVVRSSGDSVAAHRNRGARATLGSIIAFADADHEIDPCWIATAVEVLRDASVAATGAPYHTEPAANWVQQQYDGLRTRPVQQEEVAWLGSGNFALKRIAFEKVQGFNATLTACEDVDLCNRLRLAGYRIVANPNLRSVHFGDPKTLRALFFGELWRGRDNLRVTFSGPRTLRNFRSAIVPVVELCCLTTSLICLVTGHPVPALIAVLAALAPSGVRAAYLIRKQLKPNVGAAVQAFAVAVVFDLARALALLARGSHRARREA